jgi:hypothetical protein
VGFDSRVLFVFAVRTKKYDTPIQNTEPVLTPNEMAVWARTAKRSSWQPIKFPTGATHNTPMIAQSNTLVCRAVSMDATVNIAGMTTHGIAATEIQY